jgi:hypothetical protein
VLLLGSEVCGVQYNYKEWAMVVLTLLPRRFLGGILILEYIRRLPRHPSRFLMSEHERRMGVFVCIGSPLQLSSIWLTHLKNSNPMPAPGPRWNNYLIPLSPRNTPLPCLQRALRRSRGCSQGFIRTQLQCERGGPAPPTPSRGTARAPPRNEHHGLLPRD